MASLMDVANALATANLTRPAQPFLKRAVSTAYYAVFHELARECADLFVGKGSARSGSNWVHVFRALEHDPTKNACTQIAALGLSANIVIFADALLDLQQERHKADDDPAARYRREDLLDLIEQAKIAIPRFRSAPRSDRRTLAIHAMFKKR